MNVVIDYCLIGQRIRDCRQQAHLTQAELAERAGVCQQFIGNLERGKGIPSLATVMSLCNALSVDPNALLLDCARDNPEAPCTLRDVPSMFTNTLTALWFESEQPATPSAAPLDPEAFPLFDITLEDIADSGDVAPGDAFTTDLLP